MQDQIVASIDVGTSKTAVVVGHIDREGHLHIVGTTQVPAQGMRRGGIVNMDETSNTIAIALERAAHLTDQRIESAYFAITGPQMESRNHRSAIAITPADREVEMDDIKRVLDVAGAVPLDNNRIVMAVMPRSYTLDGQDGIKNPIGMAGHLLEVEAHVVTGISGAYRNLVKCAERAHVAVEDVVVAPLAAAEAVLAPGERDSGTVLIDIGGGTADVTIFADGGPWRTFCLPIGGNLITDDIAYGLRLPTAVAEALKVTYGSATPAHIPRDEVIDLGQFLPHCKEAVQRYELAHIIFARLEEMLILIRDEIRKSGRERIMGGGVVLTGGTAELAGITEVAEHVFMTPIRIGAPHSLYGATDTIVHPAYATSVGLLRWHEKMMENARHTKKASGRLFVWIAEIKRLLGFSH